MDLRPYFPQSDPSTYPVGHADSDYDPMRYTFTNQESLVAHFAQWFPQDWILALIEAEKEVFVVRRECSLEETRMQFLKKCENTLLRWLHYPRTESQFGA